jgi:hypothetical protein
VPARFRPKLETLEDRTMLSTLVIDSSGNLFFNAGNNVTHFPTVSSDGNLYTFDDPAESITLGGEAAAFGWTGSGTNTVSGPVGSISQIKIALGDQQDELTLQATYVPTFISGNGGGGVGVFLEGDQFTTQNLIGPIAISNLPANSAVLANDAADPNYRTITVTNNTITGLTQGGIEYSNLGAGSQIQADVGKGGDTVYVQSTAPDITTGIVASHPANIIVGNAGSIRSIQGELDIDCVGTGAVASLVLDDSADLVGRIVSTSVQQVQNPFSTETDVTLSGLAPGHISYALAVTFPENQLTYDSILSVEVRLGAGDNSFETVATNVAINIQSFGGNLQFVLDPLVGTILPAPAAPVNVKAVDGGDNTFVIRAAAAGVFVGAAHGNNTIIVGDTSNTLDEIQAPVEISPGDGTNSLTINDQGAASGQTYAVTPTTIDRTGAATITYYDITNLVLNASNGGNIIKIGQIGQFPMGLPGDPIQINAGSGTNAINVYSIWAPTIVNGQTGSNSVSVGSQGLLAGILEPLTLTSTGGSMAVTLDDSADPNSTNASITNSSIIGLASSIIYYPPNPCTVAVLAGFGGNVFNIYSSSVTTSLNPGAGDDVVNVLASSAPLRINDPTLPGFGGTDQVSLGANGDLSGITAAVTVTNPSGPSTLTVDDSADPTPRVATIANNTLTGLTAAAISWSAETSSAVIIDGGSGGNTFLVESIYGVPVTINTGAGNDTVKIAAIAQVLDGIAIPLTVSGGAGMNSLGIYDQGTTGAQEYQVFAGLVTRTPYHPPDPLGNPTQSISYAGIQSFNLNAGSGGGVISVESTLAGTSSSLYGHGGYLFLAENAINLLDDIQGPVAFHGGGTDGVELFDAGNTVGHTYTLTTGLLQRNGMADITYDGMEALVLATGDNVNQPPSPDTVDLQSNSIFTVVAVGDADTVTLGMPSGGGHTLQTLLAPVRVQSQTGANRTPTLVIDDSGDASTATRTVTMDNAGVNGYGITGMSPAPFYALFDSTASVSMIGNGGNEAFAANAWPTFQMAIDGQGGTNSLSVSDQADAGQEYYGIYTDHVNRGPLTTPPSNPTQTIQYRDISNLTLTDGTNGSDLFYVYGTTAGTPVSLYALGRYDDVVSESNSNLDAIQGPLAFHGNGISNNLLLSDYSNPVGHTFTLSGSGSTGTLVRDGMAAVTFDGNRRLRPPGRGQPLQRPGGAPQRHGQPDDQQRRPRRRRQPGPQPGRHDGADPGRRQLRVRGHPAHRAPDGDVRRLRRPDDRRTPGHGRRAFVPGRIRLRHQPGRQRGLGALEPPHRVSRQRARPRRR